jgi:hypothetical protein
MATEEHTKGRWRPWFETVAVTLLGTALGMAFSSTDWWRTSNAASLLLLLPVLCGAQYGVLHGVIGGTLLSILTFSFTQAYGRALPLELTSWSIACIGIGAVAGQFRDVAERRRSELTRSNRALAQQLERAKRGVYALKLSHAQLEERLAARRWSFASALQTAEKRIRELTSPQEMGEVLLELLSSQAMVQAASLYAVNAGEVLPTPVACLGKGSGDAYRHTLLERAIRTRRLTAVSDPAKPISSDPSVLAAVPLLTSAGGVIGVVAIHQMPFMAFHSEQLRKLFLITVQLTDLMQDRLSALQAPPGGSPRAASVQLVRSLPLGHRATVLHPSGPSPAQRPSSPNSQGLECRPSAHTPVAR